MPSRGIWQLRKHHIIRRHIEQLVICGIVKMVMMIDIRVEHVMVFMHRHPPQQAHIGELVQRIIYCGVGNIRPNSKNLGTEAISRHMPVPPIQQ